jgi:hypothetical protein
MIFFNKVITVYGAVEGDVRFLSWVFFPHKVNPREYSDWERDILPDEAGRVVIIRDNRDEITRLLSTLPASPGIPVICCCPDFDFAPPREDLDRLKAVLWPLPGTYSLRKHRAFWLSQKKTIAREAVKG